MPFLSFFENITIGAKISVVRVLNKKGFEIFKKGT